MKLSLIALMVAIFAAMIIATPLQNLSQHIAPQSSLMNSQQIENFKTVTIKSIDGETLDWVDGAKHDETAVKPLFIYEAPCSISWVNPTTTLEGDKATVAFIWCEEDDKSCQATTSVRVANLDIATPSAITSIDFEIPTLAWTKYFSSHIRFEITHTRGENDDVLAVYKSQVYESDFTTKTTKGVIIVVVVFCSVCIIMALAVLTYFIVKKVKKMRRGRHFPSSEHNFWRRK